MNEKFDTPTDIELDEQESMGICSLCFFKVVWLFWYEFVATNWLCIDIAWYTNEVACTNRRMPEYHEVGDWMENEMVLLRLHTRN